MTILLAIAAAAVVVYLVLRGGSASTPPAPKPAAAASLNVVHLAYPNDWSRVPASTFSQTAGKVIVALRQRGGKGVMLVRRDKEAPKLDSALATSINRKFKAQLSDYRFIVAKLIATHAGKVFFFSYVRTKEGHLHTITIVPAGDHSFLIDTVSTPSATKVTNEIGQIIRSLRLT